MVNAYPLPEISQDEQLAFFTLNAFNLGLHAGALHQGLDHFVMGFHASPLSIKMIEIGATCLFQQLKRSMAVCRCGAILKIAPK